MTKLPRVSGRECVTALAKAGFFLNRQQGSHMILRREDPFCQVGVPDHRELDRGKLRGHPPAGWFDHRATHFLALRL